MLLSCLFLLHTEDCDKWKCVYMMSLEIFNLKYNVSGILASFGQSSEVSCTKSLHTSLFIRNSVKTEICMEMCTEPRNIQFLWFWFHWWEFEVILGNYYWCENSYCSHQTHTIITSTEWISKPSKSKLCQNAFNLNQFSLIGG